MITNTPVMGNWKEHKKKLKEKFANLTDEDLEFEPGSMNEMFEKIKIKLGKSKDEMHRFIEHLSRIF